MMVFTMSFIKLATFKRIIALKFLENTTQYREIRVHANRLEDKINNIKSILFQI